MQLVASKFEEFRAYLETLDFTFEDRPYQVFLARRGTLTVNLYQSGKITFGGRDAELQEKSIQLALSLGASHVEKAPPPAELLEFKGITRIGTDEVGKGDYFGPLVIAGVLIDKDDEIKLKEIGVRDSKLLSDVTIGNLAYKIKNKLADEQFTEVPISPLKYNIRYNKLRNVNRILGWGHARAIEDLLTKTSCDMAIADQFGDESYIKNALMKSGKKIELKQMPRAERDVAVAAASILARDKFLTKMREMGEEYGTTFPRGASNVIKFAQKFVETYGMGALQTVAKLHFSTTRRITGGPIPVITKDVEEKVESRNFTIDISECFALISSFEKELRQFIEKELSKYYGEEWWEKGIDPDIRGRCEKLAKGEAKKGRKADLLDCLEFPHYRIIITKNWEEIFSKIFKDKEQLLARLTILGDIRNPVTHSRGTIGLAEKRDVISAIAYIRRRTRGNEIGKEPIA